MNLPRRRFLHVAAGAAALPAVPRVARAQAYPARPVRLLIGFAPRVLHRVGIESTLDFLAPGAAREAVDDLDACFGTFAALNRLLENDLQVTLRALAMSVKMRTRRLFHFGGFPCTGFPKGGRCGQRFRRIQSIR